VINQPNLILFATDQPLLVAGLCEVLRLAGFDSEHAMLGPRDAFTAVRREDAWLIFFDAKQAPAPISLAQSIRRSPRSRFVLCGSAITAEMLQTAFDSCVHGVLSTDLPIEEAAAALARIWQGERQFRFSGEPHCHTAAPPASPAEFDADWMFGHAV
jgi:DNA-binding NarL/FixJ family response regulator